MTPSSGQEGHWGWLYLHSHTHSLVELSFSLPSEDAWIWGGSGSWYLPIPRDLLTLSQYLSFTTYLGFMWWQMEDVPYLSPGIHFFMLWNIDLTCIATTNNSPNPNYLLIMQCVIPPNALDNTVLMKSHLKACFSQKKKKKKGHKLCLLGYFNFLLLHLGNAQ